MHWTVLMVAAALAAPAGDVKRAAQLEAWGDLAEARAEVEVALARDAKDAGAALVAACLDLEEGKLEAAKARASAPPLAELPQGKVLRALVERRRAHPEEKLRDALAPAWKAAGRPDLSGGVVPGEDGEVWTDAEMRIPDRVSVTMTPGERVVFGSWIHGDVHREALAASIHPETNPPAVNEEVLEGLRRGEDPLSAEEIAAAARVGNALIAADRDNGYWPFDAWAATTARDTALTAADLDVLERAAARPRFEIPRAQLLAELREIAGRIDPAHARCRAARAELQSVGSAMLGLQLKLKSTKAEGELLRVRAARVVRTIGQRLAGSRTYFEHLVGFSLATQGARLSGDPAAPGQEDERWKGARDRYHRASAAARRAGTWPFSSICAEWSPDEVTYFGRYAD